MSKNGFSKEQHVTIGKNFRNIGHQLASALAGIVETYGELLRLTRVIAKWEVEVIAR